MKPSVSDSIPDQAVVVVVGCCLLLSALLAPGSGDVLRQGCVERPVRA